MINVFYDTTQIITFYLKPSLSNPVYLFSLVNYTTRERLNFISTELSNGSDLLQFQFTEVGDGIQDLLNGAVSIKNFGRYTLEVYEQVSPINLDQTLATFLGDDELFSHKPVIYDFPPIRNDLSSGVGCSISVIASVTDETSAGSNDGTATANIMGNQGNITYSWSTIDGIIPAGEETKQTATGLSAGTYTVIVRDDIAAGCMATDSGTVNTGIDNYLEFNGVNNYGELDTEVMFLAGQSYTAQIQFKPEDLAGGLQILFGGNGVLGHIGISNSTTIFIRMGGGSRFYTVPAMSNGSWYVLHVLTDGASERVYLDGVESSSSPKSVNAMGTVRILGSLLSSGANAFMGGIDNTGMILGV
ncbi:MAG: SprB repeat-containing protein, partial [Gammaproteobacteria bacterium]|nr:SprB repeat-containing protein [Gammaproteobacteria bacterium]